MISIVHTDPCDSDARRLIDASEAYLSAIYPPEERFALSVDALVEEDVWFVLARQEKRAIGCGGLARYPGYGELKRIFVDPAARGQGVGHRILDALEAQARAEDLPCMRLETGADLEASVALYKSRGYRPRPAFGDYPENGASLFMEKPL
ncbi:MAG: GNAT family N-acetyltransferase [Pseudomonadota bacterium]